MYSILHKNAAMLWAITCWPNNLCHPCNLSCTRYDHAMSMQVMHELEFHPGVEVLQRCCYNLYHSFHSLCSISPIFGALIADSFLEEVPCHHLCPYCLLYQWRSFGFCFDWWQSWREYQDYQWSNNEFDMEYALWALSQHLNTFQNDGNHSSDLYCPLQWGIKPCIVAFGGDQFKLPEQQLQLDLYFSMFYAFMTAGGMLGTILTPYLRQNFTCFGKSTCYPLAYGVLVVAAVILIDKYMEKQTK